MYDLIILGGGPAGLTAAIYAGRKRLNFLVIAPDLGGKTNYRLQLPDIDHHLVINGEETISRFAHEVELLHVARRLDQVEAVTSTPEGYRVQTQGGATCTARALIVATGARAQRLNVPGEKEFMMRGLCYSTVSYAPLFSGRKTVVIGDTALALRSALDLAQIAREVTVILPAPVGPDSAIVHRLRSAANVIMMEGYQVERIKGDDYARRLVVRNGAEVCEIGADVFFVEFDLLPNSQPVASVVECDAHGRIKIDAHNRTSAPGVFAAGDVTNVYAEQVLIAIGEGAKAALSAYDYLLGLPVERSITEPLEAGEYR